MSGAPSEPPASDPAKGDAAFRTTDWSIVLDAGTDGARKRRALERLCRTYWQPVYGFIRLLGNEPEHAKDLAQAFFAHLLETDFFATADPDRGRFRAYLRQTCRHFLGNQWQKMSAQKRGGSKPPISLDDLSTNDEALFASTADPAAEYDRQWALALLRKAMARLEEEYRENGEDRLLAALRPYLTARPAPGDYDRLARELGVSRGTIPVLVHRLGKRYQELIRAEVSATVAIRSEVDAELRHCLAALGG